MVTEFNVQPSNTPKPMLITLLGIVIDVRPVQFLKATPPISITLLGMVIEVRPEQL
jgi:hypothetical protein